MTTMNAEQQKRFDELMEKEFPTDRFIEKEDENSLSVTCTCGWYSCSRRRGKERRRQTINAAKNVHLALKH